MLTTDFQKIIHQTRYARWLPEEKRRETWPETVTRYLDAMQVQAIAMGHQLDEDTYHKLYNAIHNLDVMPSMRAMMTAGEALRRDNVAGYNCAFVAIDHILAFSEVLHILMCGTGVGFSVEYKAVEQLPKVAEKIENTDTTVVVGDSKAGWAKAYKELISLLYSGRCPKWDISKVRPAGSRLKVFGGRASGPGPLEELFRFTVSTFRGAEGRKLRPIEVHDIVCKIASSVVVGGVRRSALISLSDLNDNDMRASKFGQWWETSGQRALANNSAVYRATPSMSQFLSEWRMLYESKSGERGIFNREASKVKCRSTGRRNEDHDFGTNPCSEIILRSGQFCNLTEVIIKENDTEEDLLYKVELATILGTIQSTFTDFKHLRKIWKTNCEEERLLGVSLTGIHDNKFTAKPSEELKSTLNYLREACIMVNKRWAERFGINQSTAITCVKPSGTVSKLVDSSSGIHGRFAPYYIQRMRNDVKDPLSQFLIDQGIPYEMDVTNPNNYVFSFAIKSPKHATISRDLTALEQLEIWKFYQDNWCEHKPSCTVYYKEDEFMAVGDWVYRNFDAISGISFMPYDDHVYQQAPWEAIDEERYNEMVDAMPEINWDAFVGYEEDDNTTGSQELACKGGVCEII